MTCFIVNKLDTHHLDVKICIRPERREWKKNISIERSSIITNLEIVSVVSAKMDIESDMEENPKEIFKWPRTILTSTLHQHYLHLYHPKHSN